MFDKQDTRWYKISSKKGGEINEKKSSYAR